MAVRPLENESELLAKIAGGDQLAFKVVFEYYHDAIYKFAFRLLREKEEAREIFQESMLHIWQLGYKLTEIKNLEAYLKILVKRKSIDRFRHKLTADQAEEKLAAEYREGHNETEERILMNEARGILEEGIKQLSPQQQQVYRLCYQQGMKYDQVAEQLQISHGTVQTHMKIALKHLRQYIKNNSDIAAFLIIFKLL